MATRVSSPTTDTRPDLVQRLDKALVEVGHDVLELRRQEQAHGAPLPLPDRLRSRIETLEDTGLDILTALYDVQPLVELIEAVLDDPGTGRAARPKLSKADRAALGRLCARVTQS